VRLEIVEKITGKAKYTTDYYPDKMLWAGYIRCPYGKASLKSHDLEAARKVPGVLEIELTREDGRYPGERMGHICAESRRAYDAAKRALKFEWDIAEPVTDLDKAKTPLEEIEAPSNMDKADEAFKEGATSLEATYETQVQTHTCLEPHIGMVDYRGDKAIAYGSTQGTFSFRDELTDPLGLKADQIEFHCEHVGGGFGSKFGAGAEGDLAARMSKKYNRPCRCGLDRKEEHLDAGLRPGSMQYMKVAVDSEGKYTGGRIHTWGSVGHSGEGGGSSNPSRYKFGRIGKSHEDVNLNSGFPRAMRAPGHPQGLFAVELFNEEMATKLGMDPLEFRKINDQDEVRHAMYDAGAELIGWDRRKPHGQWEGPIKRGFGVGIGDWFNTKGDATVQVNVYPDGAVEVLSGSQDIGTGFRTMLADCVAHQIGIPRDHLRVKCGVSTYPPGPASGGSVTSRYVAPKALGAGQQAKEAIIDLVAKEWGVGAGSVSIADGNVTGGDKSMGWAEACKLMTQDHLTFSVSKDDDFWKPPTNSQAVQFVELTVDTETGIVRVEKVVALQEVGQAVNRHTVENQITGGVIQGLSFALFENRILNNQIGAMVNPNMDMYKIAGPVDIPEIVPIIWKSKDDAGVNSLGEPPVIPTPGAIGCALYNALGVPVRSMPLTPDKVLAALASQEGAQA
jgi:xanthine dehydrogenase YagR molybdenum-binding subunit